MAKKAKVDDLQILVAEAANLQEAVKGLNSMSAKSDEITEAIDGIKLALNRIIIEILSNHQKKVQIRLDPKQKKNWDDFHAVLEIIYEAYSIKIPVPKLRALAPELAKNIKKGLEMNTYTREDGKTFSFFTANYTKSGVVSPSIYISDRRGGLRFTLSEKVEFLQFYQYTGGRFRPDAPDQLGISRMEYDQFVISFETLESRYGITPENWKVEVGKFFAREWNDSYGIVWRCLVDEAEIAFVKEAVRLPTLVQSIVFEPYQAPSWAYD